MWIRKWMLLLLCLTAAAKAEISADAIDVNDPDRKQAFQLYRQHNMPEAANLLEKVVAKHPTDVAAQEALGAALVGRAETQTDAEKARADRLSARRALLHAKELGDTSDLCRILLAQIPETGESAPLAAKPEVHAALKLGEAAFAKGACRRPSRHTRARGTSTITGVRLLVPRRHLLRDARYTACGRMVCQGDRVAAGS